MAVYEYKCVTCGILFKHTAAMAAAPLQVNPDCESGSCNLERLISRCSGRIAGRNIVSALRESAAAKRPEVSPGQPAGHSCSFHCDHK